MVLVLAMGQPAAAATAYSSSGFYGPVAGKSYYTQAYVSNWSSTSVVARVKVDVASGSVSTGWIGILPRLYKGTALCAQASDFTYNGQTAAGLDVPVYGWCGSGSYSSEGSTRAWNGSSYNGYSTFRSPNINA